MKNDSGGMARSGWASSINRSRVVPDRETATTKGNGVPAGVGSDMRPYDTGAVERQPSPPADRPERVIAVTVTYRRPELLLPLIRAVRGQTRPPDGYLVVDNGGNAAVPDDARGLVDVLRPEENLGPAGGYALGFGRALAAGAGRVWVLDDDLVPDPSCLARLLGSDADIVLPRQRRTAGSQAWLPWVGGLYRSRTVASAGPPRPTTSSGPRTTSSCAGSAARAPGSSAYRSTWSHTRTRCGDPGESRGAGASTTRSATRCTTGSGASPRRSGSDACVLDAGEDRGSHHRGRALQATLAGPAGPRRARLPVGADGPHGRPRGVGIGGGAGAGQGAQRRRWLSALRSPSSSGALVHFRVVKAWRARCSVGYAG
jgi:hypothetical protein